VKNHLHNIFDKLGVSDRLELALYAIHKGLHLPQAGYRFAPAIPCGSVHSLSWDRVHSLAPGVLRILYEPSWNPDEMPCIVASAEV
jgi:hypothetical protein